jgi:ABC-type lipoprotein release transport system permease subunit
VPPVSVAWTALAVLPACVLAGLIPAWLSWRAHPQEVLRESD